MLISRLSRRRPRSKKRKKAGRKAVGDTYGVRESREPACRAPLRFVADPPNLDCPNAGRPQRKKPKKTKAPLPVETIEDCESDASQKDPDDGNPFKRAVDDDSDESQSAGKAASNEPNAAATEPTAADEVEVAGFSAELLLKLPFEMFAQASAPMRLFALPCTDPASSATDLLPLRLRRPPAPRQDVKEAARNPPGSHARSIWSRCRERTGYILPTDMSELQFVLFIASETCQVR